MKNRRIYTYLMLGTIAIAIAWTISISKEDDKIIFRGIYSDELNKPFSFDTMYVTKDRKIIDSVLSFVKSAKLVTNATPVPKQHEYYNWFEFYYFEDGNEKIKLTFMPYIKDDFPVHYFIYENKLFDGNQFVNFIVDQVKKKYTVANST